MDPISNSDRLVRMLRQRLEERAQTKLRSTMPTVGVQARGVEATKALAGWSARAGGSAAWLHRTLVEQLLTDQFGASVVNETKFQQVIDKVTAAMEADPGVAEMFAQVVTELKREV